MATEARSRRRRGLRRLLGTLVVLVVLGVVAFGAAAWYYAGEIHSGALEVDRSSDPGATDTVIESVTGGQALLRSTGSRGEDDPLRRPDTYGLIWDGGAALISGSPLVRGDGLVRRTFEVVDGEPPAPGTAADLRGDVWTDPQVAHGVEYEEVAVPCGASGNGSTTGNGSTAGECPAWFVPGEAATWMVFVHGKGASRTESLRALGPAVEAGLPALVITYRNDEGAPADPSGRYGYGTTEWRDLEAAVGYATEQGAEDVVLYGASMGGAVVAGFLERSDRADVVSAVVLDAPMLDLDATVEHGAAQRELPLIGALPGVLTDAAQWIAGWRYDLDWDETDYLPADWLAVPALVFHGTDDDTVPVGVTDEFAADRPGLVDAVRLDAGHVRAWNVDPEAYEAKVAAFLDCVTADTGSSAPSCAV